MCVVIGFAGGVSAILPDGLRSRLRFSALPPMPHHRQKRLEMTVRVEGLTLIDKERCAVRCDGAVFARIR